MHVGEVLEAIKELVVMTHRMNLGLHMAQFVDGLHLAGNPGTDSTQLTTHMAGPLYDYGFLAIFPILLLWNRPRGLVARALFISMAVLVMLNTGIGTYLFILFGVFALIEQKHRSAQRWLHRIASGRCERSRGAGSMAARRRWFQNHRSRQ